MKKKTLFKCRGLIIAAMAIMTFTPITKYIVSGGGTACAAELTYEQEKELEKKKDDEAIRLRSLKPTETAEGGYSLNEPLKVGMKVTYTHELYTATCEVANYGFSGNAKFGSAAVLLTYTFTPKYNGKWNLSFYEDYNDPIDAGAFKDASGNVLSTDNTQVAGVTYTASVLKKANTAPWGYNDLLFQINLNSPEIETASDFTGYYDHKFGFILPLVISSIDDSLVIEDDITANSITLDGSVLQSLGYQPKSVGIFYKEASAAEWQQAESTTITGLKGNTEYQIKVNYIKDVYGNADKTKVLTLTSPDSNVISVLTSMNTKVDIKSVKISKAKVKKFKYKGYWWWSSVRRRWVWEKPSTSTCTRFKVTVTIKKKVPGAKGYWINIDGANQYMMDGSKTKCSFYALVKGKKIGKKVTVKACAYNRAGGKGMGPLGKAKKAKVKK